MNRKRTSKIYTPEPPQEKYPLEQGVMELSDRKKLGVALVGLGKYCVKELMPALEQSEFCRIAAIVTGSPEKAEEYSKKYDLPRESVYNYENFDNIKNNSDVDIVYIVLPNSMHAEYTIRAAKAKKHVICEKPMAVSVKECEQMIAACKEANRLLFIGYRLHYEPHNLEAMKFGQQELLGSVKKVEASFGFQIGDPDQWRLKKDLAGGGCLMDVGIYTIQAARYVLGQEPVAVKNAFMEKDHDKKFNQVEGEIKWEMEFSNGVVAFCYASYINEIDKLFIEEENGWMELNPAFYYEGLKGKTSERELEIPNINQQKAQIDGIAKTILTGSANYIPGTMGLQDLRIIEAIYTSAKTGERVELEKIYRMTK